MTIANSSGRARRRLLPGCRLLMVALLLLACREAGATVGVVIASGGFYEVPVTSYQESRFQRVIRQQYDFSCGSAALATLLTYHYDQTISEQEVFQAMYQLGNQERIRRNGFSLLDMKIFLESRGLLADGYELPFQVFAELGVPAITLISKKRYRHFVVVKGVSPEEVLVGDPAAGLRVMSRVEFEALSNGIFFLVRSEPELGRQYFNHREEWLAWKRAPAELAVSRASLASFTLNLPPVQDF